MYIQSTVFFVIIYTLNAINDTVFLALSNRCLVGPEVKAPSLLSTTWTADDDKHSPRAQYRSLSIAPQTQLKA